MSEEQRQGGAVVDGKWLVVTESTREEEGKAWVHNCGTPLSSVQVAHPIHDGPFPLSGGGRCEYETVPFCTACETQPSFHGMPVTR